MSILRLWVKALLFFSAYTPLFIILILKNIDPCNIFFYISLGLLVLLNLILILIFRRVAKKINQKKVNIKEMKDKTSDALNYVFPYIIAFIGFEFQTWQDWVMFLLLIFIIFTIYTNSNLIFINPMLNLIGYKIYKIVTIDNSSIIILSKKKKIDKNSILTIKNISDNIYLEVNIDD